MNEDDRRALPPLSALDSLIVAVRTNSFSRAADRLALTQGAVSRRIALLEDWLQIPLFERHGRRVVATKQAVAYVDAIEPAIRRIRTATLVAMATDQAVALTIATLPSFGMRWLAPRLPGLTTLHPEMIVNFAARSVPFDFAEEAFDAAIHFGLPDWPDADHDLLFREEAIAVCSPSWLAKHPVGSPADMLGWPLLVLASRRGAWARWFAAAGIGDATPRDGPVYEHFLMLAHAAAAGVGVALIPSFLIAPELAAGTLVAPLDIRLRSEEAYYLVRPNWRPMSPTLDAFRLWVLGEAAGQAG